MTLFNKLQFDDIDSLDHGIYITGSAAFNSPSRDVEMVAVPGRNGELIRDNGRYNNIEVTYPAGTFGDDEDNFRKKIREFRSLLASKRGYFRLVDSYNPDECRMATFIDAIEAEPVAHNIAAEFDLVFNCKPQRFLMSGESEISVSDGENIFNPTPFDASPMILTEGYGSLTVNGYEINITNDALGRVLLVDNTVDGSIYINGNIFDQGDSISVERAQMEYIVDRGELPSNTTISNIELLSQTGVGVISIDISGYNSSIAVAYFGCEFEYGTSKYYDSTYDLKITLQSGIILTETLTVRFRYGGDSHFWFSDAQSPGYFEWSGYQTVNMYGVSTKTSIGHPTYIDCDLGEVYKIENGAYISLNHLTDLGSNLPALSPGNNLIEYDNTFTDVKIIPRWWVV